MSSAPPPVIEILGPWLQNNGDGLNLWSIARRFSSSATLAVSSMLGLDRLPAQPRLAWIKWMPDLRRAARSRSPRELARAARDVAALALAPRSMLHARGIVRGREITALLDCSGFAYGDAWSIHRIEQREAYYRKLRRQGTRIILLPQAFGPFNKPDVRDWTRRLMDHCDWIYARDAVSLEHLKELGVEEKTRGIVPDITHFLSGNPPADGDRWRRRVCIVPNARMMDKTAPEIGRRYEGFLLQSIRTVQEAGFEPCLLVHEQNDLPLAKQLSQGLPAPPPIINEDALDSKGILGACHAVVGSRYHALVSALSQGVPVIGTSWSHKYEQLFDDYGCRQHLISPEQINELTTTLQRLLDDASRSQWATQLSQRAAEQKRKVEQMWSDIESMILR